jgi:hypothetical protein
MYVPSTKLPTDVRSKHKSRPFMQRLSVAYTRQCIVNRGALLNLLPHRPVWVDPCVVSFARPRASREASRLTACKAVRVPGECGATCSRPRRRAKKRIAAAVETLETVPEIQCEQTTCRSELNSPAPSPLRDSLVWKTTPKETLCLKRRLWQHGKHVGKSFFVVTCGRD